MQEDITASTKELMDQAPATALYYYSIIADQLDKKYGKGWSKQNSDAVSRVCLAAAVDFHTSITNRSLQQLRDKQIFPLDPIQVDVLGSE